MQKPRALPFRRIHLMRGGDKSEKSQTRVSPPVACVAWTLMQRRRLAQDFSRPRFQRARRWATKEGGFGARSGGFSSSRDDVSGAPRPHGHDVFPEAVDHADGYCLSRYIRKSST